jgi:hypothetical protein
MQRHDAILLLGITVVANVTTARAGAQTHVVLPASAAQTDAVTTGRIAGFASPFRQQIVIDGRELGNVLGRYVAAVTFRRDGQYLRALAGGQTTIKVTLSSTARSPQDTSPVFDANHGSSRAVVFDGSITLPASPALPHRDAASWSSPHAVEVQFQTAFHFIGPNLVMEIEGVPGSPAATWWPVDYVHDSGRGVAIRYGRRCGRYSNLSTSAAGARIGDTVQLVASGEVNSAGALLIGSTPLVPGINLGFLAAPACELAVDPSMVFASWYQPFAGDPTAPGLTNLSLHIPWSDNLLGASLFAQGLNLAPSAPGRLTTTTGLQVTIAGARPSSLWAIVDSGVARTVPMPATGAVQHGRIPVILFTVRDVQ